MTDTALAPASKGRRTTFIVLTVLFGVGAGAAFGFLSLVSPWLGVEEREIHAVHDLTWGIHGGLLLAVPFLLQAVRPERKPALMLAVALAGLALAIGYALGGVWMFAPAPIVLSAILWWLHPAREAVAPSGRRPYPAMVAVAILAAVPLVVYALEKAALQRACPPTGNPHCDEFHFASVAALAFAFPLTALAASFQTPGWRVVAWLTGVGAILFGFSGVLLEDRTSSIGSTWGLVAIGGGVLFVAVAEWAGRGDTRLGERAERRRSP